MRKLNDDFERVDSVQVQLEELKYFTVHLPYGRDKTAIVKVPKFLVNAFKFLHEHRYLESEGIYRKQGNASKISNVETCFLSGELADDLSIYDVCVMVKRFIKCIKGGLFGLKEERIVSAAFDQCGTETPRTLCHFCHTLPSCNYGILSYIIFQLNRVVRHSATNKMDAANLAIVFVPAMFQSFDRKIAMDSKDLTGIKERQETLKATVVLLINHVTDLISPQPNMMMLRNNSMNRTPILQSFTANVRPTPPVNVLPKRSTSVASSHKPVAIPLPRYTHAAAPNVVRPRGAVAAAAEKSKDKTFVRIARRRSKSLLRNVINTFTGNNSEQYSVNNDGKSEQKQPKAQSRRSKLMRRNTSS